MTCHQFECCASALQLSTFCKDIHSLSAYGNRKKLTDACKIKITVDNRSTWRETQNILDDWDYHRKEYTS